MATMENKHAREQNSSTANVEDIPASESISKRLSFVDRFLAVWIFLAMVLGILLGCFVPDVHDVLEAATLVGVSAPIGFPLQLIFVLIKAAGLIVMMYPILCKVRFEELNSVFKDKNLWKQLGFSFIVNWIVAPFIMVCPHFGISDIFSLH
jgi:arsenite transporter